jgi:hypothetical protein
VEASSVGKARFPDEPSPGSRFNQQGYVRVRVWTSIMLQIRRWESVPDELNMRYCFRGT